MKRFTTIIALSSILIFAACGKKLDGKLDGTYSAKVADAINQSITFGSNGKVIFDNEGMKSELDYSLDGNNVKISSPGGTEIMTIIDDKTIEGPMGIKFVKSK